jgi:hypothetical protein
VLRIVHRAIHTHLLKQTHVKRADAASGAITLIQRFGSAANLNTHLHALVLDGVYQTSEGAPVFIEAPAPSNEQLQTLLDKIIHRILKLLTRLGHLIEDDGITNEGNEGVRSKNLRAINPMLRFFGGTGDAIN